MYRVVGFKKVLVVEAKNPYGAIKIFFDNPKTTKSFSKLSLTKFMALSHILENDQVGYDPKNKVFRTNVEPSEFEKTPDGKL